MMTDTADVSTPEPFTIHVADERLLDIRERVERFDWDGFPDAGGWTSGAGVDAIRHLVRHWITRYDWREQEERLNRLPHFTVTVAGQRLHFVHARGDGSAAPVLLLHGWPGSFLEFEELIAPLVADGHDVIVPSLPGYAFSGRPAYPIGPRRTAEMFHQLMVMLQGPKRYLVQGGDWGAAVGAWMAYLHPEACGGLHLNMVLVQAEDVKPRSEEERAWKQKRLGLAKEEAGYAHAQSTRPQTLGYALSDSPVGVAAWIGEKFAAWSDGPLANGVPDPSRVFGEDRLLTNIMLYVATCSIVTSTWMYRGRVLEGSSFLPAGGRITVPTAVAAFPDPVFPPPPQSLVSRTYDLVRWREMPRGGHFAAMEQPELLLADLRQFRDQLAS